MKKIRLYIIAAVTLLIASSGTLQAQTCTINGYVKDGPLGAALAGFTIQVFGTGIGTISDANGHYTLNVPSGTVTIDASYIGYTTTRRTIVAASGGTYRVDFWFNAVTDIDGNSYSGVTIGSQLWMGENLKVTRFNDGKPINYGNTASYWITIGNSTTAGYGWYNYNIENKDSYGALYNWWATATGSLCPTGWHVPSDADWTVLSDYLGGLSQAGGKMKSVGTTIWTTPNTGATNESTFTGLPGGSRNPDGVDNNMGTYGYFWTSTGHSIDPDYAWGRVLGYNQNDLIRADYYFKKDGFSVRCVKNAPPTATISGTTSVCQGATSPNITFTAIDGVAPYTFTYSINGGSSLTVSTTTGNSVDVPAPTSVVGTFTYTLISVQDANTTVSQSGTAVVTVNPVPTANSGPAMSPICQGGTTAPLGGSVGGAATGGVWSSPNGGTFSPSPTNLNATWTPPAGFSGMATLFLTTTGGYCGVASGSKTVTVEPKPDATIGTADITNVACYGESTGAVNLTVSGGVQPYSFSWSNGATTEDLLNIPSGRYSVIVTGSNGCTANASATVTQPAAPLGVTATVQPVLCYGGDNGDIYLTVTGGTAPYSFIWNNGSTTEDLNNIKAGDYSVIITDENNCLSTYSGSVTEPELMSAELTTEDATCYDNNDGQISILNASGGMGYYEFSIDGGENWQTDTDYSGLFAGIYNVQMRDMEITNCIVVLNEELEISEPALLEAYTSTVTIETCTDCKDGTITLNVTGGTPGYTFYWTGPDEWSSETKDLENLGAGTYTATVTDINGCTTTAEAEVFNPLKVTNTENTGMGSLRNAINYANENNHEITDRIIFNIESEGTATILPLSPLPRITEPVIIDGYSQPGATESNLLIELSGTSAGTNAYGLKITSGNSTVKGLIINQFTGIGIHIAYQGNNIISGNLIGTDRTGKNDLGNKTGIQIDTSSFNTIGGVTSEERNLISGNTNGIVISGGIQSTGNIIAGNYIGTDITGTAPLGNNWGLYIYASKNTIGGATSGAGNIISGNINQGLDIIGNPSRNISANENIIQGNYVGTDVTGTLKIENGVGIFIVNSSGNQIGGNIANEGNLISGNNSMGLYVGYLGSTGNKIEGNLIGTTSDGMQPLGNGIGTENKYGYGGININGPDNTIGSTDIMKRNIISGNITGISLRDSALNCRVLGNYIGTDISGTYAIANINDGVAIKSGRNNIIGGTNSSSRNIISGNGISGVHITFSDPIPNYENKSVPATGNSILGNYIGTDISGKNPVPNSTGVKVDTEASENYIGGSVSGSGNLIAFNNESGIWLESDSTIVKGNAIIGGETSDIYITGDYNTIGGAENGSGNNLHGNSRGLLLDPGAGFNIVEGNLIGTDLKGESDMTTGNNGVEIRGSDNIIRSNLISGYEQHGIYIDRLNTESDIPERNRIESNLIGLNSTGTGYIPNGHGISINYAANNSIIKNEIAGNTNYGITIVDGLGVNSAGNLISQNSIHNNGLIGIDLGLNNISLNDLLDQDNGANNIQNYPVLDSLKFDLGNRKLFVGGSLESVPGKKYTIEFFASLLSGWNGNGEGETYLGSASVTTGADGKTRFGESFTAYSSWGDVITATATDESGNTSEFSMAIGGQKSQILSELMQPFHYQINRDGHPNILDDTDLLAVTNAFKTWTDVPTADIEFISDGTTTLRYASAIDKVNLVSFTDDNFPFSPGVLAIASKTLQIVQGSPEAKIIDADIVFNPAFLNSQTVKLGIGDASGIIDIQSVTTHEIGHILGLIHSGVVNSTMFFMLGEGISVRDLAPDDVAWASYRYPMENYDNTFGSISGRITYGYDGEPVAGALVLAKKSGDPEGTVHAYSDAGGEYLVPGLSTGTYTIHIEPLDGDVSGYSLKPGNISVYIYSNTVYTDYPDEYFSTVESNNEPSDEPVTFAVTSHDNFTGNDLITNIDLTPPHVDSVLPEGITGSLDINQIFKITFSEPIDSKSLTNETCYLESGTGVITGNFEFPDDDSQLVLFIPSESMKYSSDYTLTITEGVTDLKGNPLDPGFLETYTTSAGDETDPLLKYLIPEDDSANVYVTTDIFMSFSESMDRSSLDKGFSLNYTSESGSTVKVDGTFTWGNNNMDVKFKPLTSLLEGTDYTIILTGEITDLADNPIAPVTSLFKTVPQARPEVLYLGPDDDASGVTVKTPVVADFSEPINPLSVTDESFKLLLDGNTQVTGSFEFLNDNARVVFRPDEDLLFNRHYVVMLSDKIEDVSPAVLTLENEITSDFYTALEVLVPHIDFLEPVSGIVGSLVTVTGTGFDPDPLNNSMIFNGIRANIVNATLTSLTARVPLGAVTGPVSVVCNSVASSNSSFFYIIPVSLDPCEEATAPVSTATKSRDVDVTADAGFAYVTNPDANTVSVINLKTMTELKEISVGTEPFKIDINPQNTRAYVTNFGSHDVSVIRLSDNTLEKNIPVGINPYGVVVTPDGKRVYISNYTSPFLSVIDADPLSGGFDRVVANVSTNTSNRDVAVTADAGLVLVAGDDGLKIVCSDPKDLRFNTVIANTSSGTKTRDVDVSADAGLAFVTTEDGNIIIVDISPASDYFGAAIASVTTPTKSGDVKTSGDALFIYVSNPDENTVSVYKISSGGTGLANSSYYGNLTLTLNNTINVGDSPEGLVIDGTNQRLLVVNSGAETSQASVQEIIICCGPIPVPTLIGELIMTIQTMINNQVIKEAIGNDLIKYLNSALNYIAANKIKNAINSLNTFIVKVQDLVKSSQITQAQGQPLIDRAREIILMLGGKKSVNTSLFTGLNQTEDESLTKTSIDLVYPNPSSGSFTINYGIAQSDEEYTRVTIRVFDMHGNQVAIPVNSMMQSGRYSAVWNGTNEFGGEVPDGNYFIQLRAGNTEVIKPVIIAR